MSITCVPGISRLIVGARLLTFILSCDFEPQLIGVPTQMGVVAVYSLNDEFKSLLNETKNGMVSGASYVFAKSILVLPIMIIFSLFSLGIPLFAVMGAPGASFGLCLIIHACTMYVFESVAEALSVWFEDPILGMLQFMNFWYVPFVFSWGTRVFWFATTMDLSFYLACSVAMVMVCGARRSCFISQVRCLLVWRLPYSLA